MTNPAHDKKHDKIIYFDNAATTQVLPEVAELTLHLMREEYGNPSALHKSGLAAEKLLKQARERIARAISARADEIVFTASGTEANNLALRGAMQARAGRGKHLIVSAVEHPSVLQTAEALRDAGFALDELPVDELGIVQAARLKELLRPDTVLVSVMLVNNETGAVQPIAEIAQLLRETPSPALLHVDAVQAFGRIPVDVDVLGADMLSVSGHKLHAPKGSGFLYLRRGVRLIPQITGGGQEGGLRSGTHNTPGCCALGLAAQLATEQLDERLERVAGVRERFLNCLSDLDGWQINGPTSAAPHVLNISFAGVKSEVLLHMLAEQGLMVASGSACAAKKDRLSHVLRAMGKERAEIEGAIRFSFSYLNDEEEAERAAAIVRSCVGELRQILR